MICVKRRRYVVTACFCVSACLLGRCDYAVLSFQARASGGLIHQSIRVQNSITIIEDLRLLLNSNILYTLLVFNKKI